MKKGLNNSHKLLYFIFIYVLGIISGVLLIYLPFAKPLNGLKYLEIAYGDTIVLPENEEDAYKIREQLETNNGTQSTIQK